MLAVVAVVMNFYNKINNFLLWKENNLSNFKEDQIISNTNKDTFNFKKSYNIHLIKNHYDEDGNNNKNDINNNNQQNNSNWKIF